MNKKNTTIYLYILIAVFTLFVGTATFAFFGGNNDFNATANLSAHAGGAYTFTSTSATDFNLDITSSQMSQSKSGNYISSSLGAINVNLDSPEGMITACTFDLLFTWNSSDKYTTPNVELPFTHDGTTYNYEFSTIVKDGENVVFNERDLSKVNNGSGFSGNSGTIAEGLSIEADSTSISKTYSIEARIYNLPVNQPNLIGKNMKASIKVDNVNCQYEIEEQVDVSTLNYLSTYYDSTIFNLVSKQGVDVSSVDSVYFVDTRKTKPGNVSEIAYFKGTDNNVIKAWTNGNNLYIGSKGITYLGPYMDNAFSKAYYLNVVDMDNANTSNVTIMSSMFYDTGSFRTNFTLNLGNQFNTSKVTNMSSMFDRTGYNSTIFTLDLGNEFNTSKVTNMDRMFSNTGRSSLNFTLNLGNKFNTSNVTRMVNMFLGTGRNSAIFTLDLGNKFNTSNVTSMTGMFEGTGESSSNFTLDLGNQFNTINVTSMYRMFLGTGYKSTVFTLNLGNEFNTSKVGSMREMFTSTGSSSPVFTLNLGNKFNTLNVTDMNNMFYRIGSNSLDFNLNLGNQFNTSNVTDMSYMFSSTGTYSTNFTLNLGNEFNTSKVTNMVSMFGSAGYYSTNFTLNLGNQFNTSKVTNMLYMFYNTGYSSSWTLNLKSFDFSNVTNSSAFFGYHSTTNILTVICNPLNGEFINARVSGVDGYNVVCDYTGYAQYTISLDSSVQNVIVSHTAAYNTQKITLSSNNGHPIESFKLNGSLIEGNTFIMPESNVTIADVVFSDDIVIETSHNPYENDLNNVVYYENTFDGATSITVELTYQTESTNYDWVYLYQDASTIYNNQKYGGQTQTTETITIPSNYIKIVFRTDSSGNNYYGFKALITPNY